MDGADGTDESPLALLGISDVEERVYRALLTRHRASAAEIADDLAMTLDDATTLLEHLESLGLGTHTLESPRAYVSVEPELAIDALIKQRQRILEQARTVVPTLAKTFAHASFDCTGQQPAIELITDRAQLGHVLVQMYQSAQTELVAFQKVPIILPSPQITTETATDAVVRTISDESFLEAPGVLELLRNDMAHGEQARTFSRLPFKMMIADRRIAVITLDAHDPEAPTLLIHRGTLLDALCLLFEFVWEKATPVVAARDGEVKVRTENNGHAVESAKALLPLLSAGLNDKAIAQELNISASTLNRRIGDLMSTYDARTRFQLGLQVARLNNVASR
jgi:sugar-specific transcriptional regulator TrmB